MLNPDATFALAERVADEARQLGFETAMIGAAALAVHGYTRGTEDIDLAVAVDPRTQLKALQLALNASGLATELRLPDDDDPIGGLLVVRAPQPEAPESIDVVEVVNFRNPGRLAATPAPTAIARAEPLSGSSLRCVTLGDLVALKLYAGGRAHLADIEQLLAQNPEANLDAIRSAAATFDRDNQLEALIASARMLTQARNST